MISKAGILCFSFALVIFHPPAARSQVPTTQPASPESSGLWPLSNEDYVYVSKNLPPPNEVSEEITKKVREAVSSEAGETLLKTALFMEASDRVFSEALFPQQFLSTRELQTDAQIDIALGRELRDSGLTWMIGTVIAVMADGSFELGEMAKSIPSSGRFYKKHSHKIYSLSALGGLGTSVTGLMIWDGGEESVTEFRNTSDRQWHEFIDEELALGKYVSFWSKMLDLNSTEAKKLKETLTQEILDVVMAVQANPKSTASFRDIHLIEVLKENQIGSPEKVAALERLMTVMNRISTSPELPSRPKTEQELLHVQMNALKEIVEMTKDGQHSYFRDAYPKLCDTVHREIASKLRELESALKIVTPGAPITP